MKIYVKIVFLFGFCMSCFAQIEFNGAHPLFDDQDYIFSFEDVDVTGRNSYTTAPIDGNQPCSGVGICELKIAWNNTDSQWEMLADDGNGGFSSTFLIFSNTEASLPNPPSLTLGTWKEYVPVTSGDAGGNLSVSNTILTGDVQNTILGVTDVELDNQISLYPNPVNEILNIEHSGLSMDSVVFYNVLGKLVLNANNSDTIRVSKLNPGLYFIKIKIQNNEVIKRIVVK